MNSTKTQLFSSLLGFSLMVASQVPVSIADLGGTEIDLRFANPKQGRLFVIVAPCKRFSDSKFSLQCCTQYSSLFYQFTQIICTNIY